MYQGKFSQKNKQDTQNVQQLLEQRSRGVQEDASAQRRRPAPQSPARPETAAAPRPAAKPAPQTTPAPGKRPAPSAQQAKTHQVKAKAKGHRLGGVIFYTLYFLFILLFALGTLAGLIWLNNWLIDYEAAQPTLKAEEIFEQLFADPDWDELYDLSGVEDTPYEGKTQFVAYMDSHVDAASLTYLETSAGLSGDKKYEVRMGSETVATFTLVDQNKVSTDSLEDLGEIPNWQLGSVEVFFDRENSYRIVKTNGHTAMVNGVALDDSHTIQIATTKAEEYLPEGTVGISLCTQEITDLFTKPEVTIFDPEGNPMDVTYDEATRTFTEASSTFSPITAEEEAAVKGASEGFCLWMIAEINYSSRQRLHEYYDTEGEAYSNILNTKEVLMQNNNGYEFIDMQITDFTRYSDDLFSVRSSLTVRVTRINDSIKDYSFTQSMFFRKNDSGKWLCFNATNTDITQPVGKVRLTFMQGQTQLLSEFFYTDAEEIITPVTSSVEEGKVFSGWVRRAEDENGNPILELVFQPDENGKVTIPEGTTLEPMTLYALFEDADTISDVIAETDPSATGDTTSATEGGA